MKYREFVRWCNQRACDGCWGSREAIICLRVMEAVDNFPFWKREKTWKLLYEKDIVGKIVEPINEKIKDMENKHEGNDIHKKY